MGPKDGTRARRFGVRASKCLLLAVAAFWVAPAVFAQISPGGGGGDSAGGVEPWIEYGKRIEATQRISPLENGFAGESISLYDGVTSFSVTDIDVPGNFDIPVRLARRLAIELQPQDHIQPYDSLLYGIGNWDVEVPYMAATYPTSTGWDPQRCSMGSLPPTVMGPMGLFQRPEVWQGITIHVPGRGDTSALALDPQVPIPSSGGPYRLTTTERDAFACIPMKSGLSGEGFRMTTASGMRYYFDVGATRTAAKLVRFAKADVYQPSPSGFYLERNRYYLLASKIEDRFGNNVQIDYNADGNPTRIYSSDGRAITLTYSGGRLSTASTEGRTWSYHYDASGNLTSVVLPDDSSWHYGYTGSLKPSAPPPYESLPLPWCQGVSAIIGDLFTLTATHPSGAVATFSFENERHFRSGVHATECVAVPTGDFQYPDYVLLVPYFFDVMSLTQKTITGPGLTSATWNYDYGDSGGVGLWGTHTEPANYPCTTCIQSKTVTVSNPDGTKKLYRFGMEYWLNDGRLLGTDTLSADGSTVRSESTEYMSDTAAGSQPFYPQYGEVLGGVADPLTARIRPATQTVINQDGATFTTTVNSFDNFARSNKRTEASSLGYSRTVATRYHDDLDAWVLGQMESTAVNATAGPCVAGDTTLMSCTTYDSTTALPLKNYAFGKLVSAKSWNLDGTLHTVADGNTHTTTLSAWNRGIPQTIGYADGTGESAVVNGDGWITSVTDENSYTTDYDYDPMGRLAIITYPSGDDVAWHRTFLSFAPVGTSEYGVPAGHWTQTIQTGNGETVTVFDALWRPLVTATMDTDVPSTLSQTVRRYDTNGRTVFTSYPLSNGGLNYATYNIGTHTKYDALDRVTEVDADSELGTLTTGTQYLSGFQAKVTNPRGYATTTSYFAYGQPDTSQPRVISAPESETTTFTRDVFGKPLAITRSGPFNGITSSLTRSYVYDVNQQLCERIDPESGMSVMHYDGAGNMDWSAAGLPIPATPNCSTDTATAYNSGRRVDRGYDNRNRLKALAFPDGNGDQTWDYTLDGLPKDIVTTNDTTTVTNHYYYDRRRLLTQESVGQPSWYTWNVYYGYDLNGYLSTLTYPDGTQVAYAPNGLGQPTLVSNQITGLSYFPDGKVKQFTYANGILHTLSENTRGLPSQITDSGAGVTALDQACTYDKDGNPETINDAATPQQNRSMDYDGLDRLTSGAVAYQGVTPTTYHYDFLDNLAQSAFGTRVRTFSYDASNRLVQVSDTGARTFSLSYDLQGNLATRAGQTYTFDYGNRLRGVSGLETYRYDGLGRRVQASSSPDQLNILSMYTRGGQLIYQDDARSSIRHVYLYLGSLLVAKVDHAYSGTTRARYEHTDAQGSIVAETTATPDLNGRTVYSSVGAPLNHDNDDDPGYTGHLQDSLTGLTYMQQRYYDPTLSRFLSVDPVGVDPSTGDNFNRYWYASDNPYRYTDPDGRKTTCSDKQCVTTADTFNSAKSNGQTTVASATTSAAGNAGKSRVAVPTGDEEKLGFVVRGSDGQEHVETDSDSKTQHGDSTAGKVAPEGATAAIHGHIESGLKQSDGMVDNPNPKQPMGDAQPLSLKNPLPNATVYKGKVGWHEIVNGQLQFRYPQGALNDDQTKAIQMNLNVEQTYFQHQ